MINKRYLAFLLLVSFITAFVFIAIPHVRAPSTTYYVSTSGLDTNPGTLALPWQHIQYAVTTAAAGDTIIVAAGTHSEGVVIDKSLNIIGESSANTFIDGTGVSLSAAGLVKITAAGDVTLSGFTVRNAPPVGVDAVRIEILTQSAIEGPTYLISDNKIYGTNDAFEAQDYGFYAQSGKENIVFTHNLITQTGANNIVLELHTGSTDISNNTLDAGVYGTDSIFFMTYNGIDVTTLQSVCNNTFDMGTGEAFDYDHKATGVSFTAPGAAWGLGDGAFTDMVISGNTFNNLKSNGRAIGFWNANNSAHNLISPQIAHNTINGVPGSTDSYGIDFYNLTDNAIMTCNTISGTDTAIYLRSGDAPGTQIHYNNIAGNTQGLNWTGVSTADASFNWWGNESGPNPPGSGDPVAGNASVTPYLHSPFAARLYTAPNPVMKIYTEIGTDFTLDVKVERIEDLFGFDINLTWDNSLITFQDCNYKSTLDTLWPSGWSLEQNTTGVNAGMGWYKLVAVSTSSGFNTTSNQTLFTLKFHIESGSIVLLLQKPIHFQTVKLSNSAPIPIPAAVDDGLYQISAIRGDVNCDGKVDVFDLRTLATYYDQSTPAKYDLTNDGTIDIFDLVVVAKNFGYGEP